MKKLLNCYASDSRNLSGAEDDVEDLLEDYVSGDYVCDIMKIVNIINEDLTIPEGSKEDTFPYELAEDWRVLYGR